MRHGTHTPLVEHAIVLVMSMSESRGVRRRESSETWRENVTYVVFRSEGIGDDCTGNDKIQVVCQ